MNPTLLLAQGLYVSGMRLYLEEDQWELVTPSCTSPQPFATSDLAHELGLYNLEHSKRYDCIVMLATLTALGTYDVRVGS